MTIKERLRYAIAAYVAKPSPLNAAALNQVVEAVGALEADVAAGQQAEVPSVLRCEDCISACENGQCARQAIRSVVQP